MASDISIDKWKSDDWGTNQEYALEEGMQNFFTCHNNFDYGFKTNCSHFGLCNRFFYSPKQVSTLVLYHYPKGYCHLPLSKSQQ